jgi:integrase
MRQVFSFIDGFGRRRRHAQGRPGGARPAADVAARWNRPAGGAQGGRGRPAPQGAGRAEEYIAQKSREWGASSRAIWRRFAERNIEPIAALPIDSIGLDAIKRAVTPFVDAGLIPAARSTQSRIQALLDYAAEHGWRPDDKRSRFSQIAPKARKGDEPKRHPALNPDRDADAIRAVVARLKVSTALEFVILTAVRVSEATGATWDGATWDEIDFDRALWTIPARIRLHRRSARRKLTSVWSARMAMIGRRQNFSRLCGARFTDLARPQGTTGGSPLAQADAEVPPFAPSVFTGT